MLAKRHPAEAALEAERERVRQLIEALEFARAPIEGSSNEPWLTNCVAQLNSVIDYVVGSGVEPPLLTPLVELMGELVQLSIGGKSRRLLPPLGAMNMPPLVARARKAQAAAAVTKLMEAGRTENEACKEVERSLQSAMKAGALKSFRKHLEQVEPRAAGRASWWEVAAGVYSAAINAVAELPPKEGADAILEALGRAASA